MPKINYAESILEHHGVKGMKWGVTRDRATGAIIKTKARVKQEVADRQSEDVIVRTKPGQGVRTVGGNKQMAHPDAILARKTEQIAKRSSLDAVSNKDLQALVTRMNLEQQYRNLSVHEDRRSVGEKYAMQFLDANGEKALGKMGPLAPLVTKRIGDVINGNKAFDTGNATNNKKK